MELEAALDATKIIMVTSTLIITQHGGARVTWRDEFPVRETQVDQRPRANVRTCAQQLCAGLCGNPQQLEFGRPILPTCIGELCT